MNNACHKLLGWRSRSWCAPERLVTNGSSGRLLGNRFRQWWHQCCEFTEDVSQSLILQHFCEVVPYP